MEADKCKSNSRDAHVPEPRSGCDSHHVCQKIYGTTSSVADEMLPAS